jgi:hypothetical protein
VNFQAFIRREADRLLRQGIDRRIEQGMGRVYEDIREDLLNLSRDANEEAMRNYQHASTSQEHDQVICGRGPSTPDPSRTLLEDIPEFPALFEVPPDIQGSQSMGITEEMAQEHTITQVLLSPSDSGYRTRSSGYSSAFGNASIANQLITDNHTMRSRTHMFSSSAGFETAHSSSAPTLRCPQETQTTQLSDDFTSSDVFAPFDHSEFEMPQWDID